MSTYTRRASHAGSWYTDNPSKLKSEILNYIDKAKANNGMELGGAKIKAVIGPHAGLSYSGVTSGYAYKEIDASQYKRIFLMGPSHHVWFDSPALPVNASQFNTPFYNIPIDRDVVGKLYDSGHFSKMKQNADEDEHSLELHSPFVANIVQQNPSIKLVPILLSGGQGTNELLVNDLQSHFESDENLFIISSDFCHWGSRFGYTTYYPEYSSDGSNSPGSMRSTEDSTIYKGIEAMDRDAMNQIESCRASPFLQYLSKCRNTICGRHPITVLLHLIEQSNKNRSDQISFKFLHYAQSSKVKSRNDSSVSYAAGCAYF